MASKVLRLLLAITLFLSSSASADSVLGIRTKMASGIDMENEFCGQVDCNDCGMDSPSQFSILVREINLLVMMEWGMVVLFKVKFLKK